MYIFFLPYKIAPDSIIGSLSPILYVIGVLGTFPHVELNLTKVTKYVKITVIFVLKWVESKF